jgi:hypothetical protein
LQEDPDEAVQRSVKEGAPLTRASIIVVADAAKGQQSGATTKAMAARNFLVILVSPEIAEWLSKNYAITKGTLPIN